MGRHSLSLVRGWFLRLSLCLVLIPGATRAAFLCGGADLAEAAAAKPAKTRGSLSALVVFARFQGEAAGQDRAPDWAADLFSPSVPGSFTHFYSEMSGGLLEVEGQVLPRRYVSRQPASAYLAATPGTLGRFGQFNREILEQVDHDVDLGRFDNDGTDGAPNSGDDDGYVDIVFVNLLTVPRDFLIGGATGYASLGLDTDYLSDDPAANGGPIRIRSRFAGFGGTTQRGHTFSVTAATMCHEFGHVLGLPDLFDQSSVTANGQLDPAEDSAGIGKWGLMGLGTLGWGVEDGPNTFCAWSLARLGWLGDDNARLVEVRESARDLVLDDVMRGGTVYKIPLSQEEYFLLENRQRSGSYYNRNIPAGGLLIWHVDERADNDEERHKQVDLVCADGLYADQGYPGGRPDPARGRDNLDFWSRDEAYATAHRGNQGDATDPFDGVRFRRFAWDTNPGSRAYTGLAADLPLGIAVDNIRAQGERLLVDILIRQPLPGHIGADTTWSGKVVIDQDIVVEPGATLTLAPGTEVRVAAADRLRTGFDPDRCELLVFGDLVAPANEPPALLGSAADRPGPGDWAGVYLLDGQGPQGLVVESARHGLARTRLPAGTTRWSGVQRIPWDLLVPPDAELVVESGAVVRFAPTDLSGTGLSPRLVELVVAGRLTVAGQAGQPARLTVDDLGPDSLWYGVRLASGGQVDARFVQMDQSGLAFSGEVRRGTTFRLDDSRIQHCGAGLRLTTEGTAQVRRSSLSGITNAAIHAEGSGLLEVWQTEVVRNGREGIYLGNCSLQASQVHLAGNGILDQGDPRSGLVAVGGQGQSIVIEDAVVEGNARHGIDLQGWEGEVDVRRTDLTANRGDGGRVGGVARLLLEQVRAERNLGDGAAVEAAPVRISSCVFADNVGWGLILGQGVSGVVEDSEFPRNSGMQLLEVQDLRVSRCRFEAGSIGVAAEGAGAELEGNRFTGNTTGLRTSGALLPAVRRNAFIENQLAVENLSTLTLAAEGNYWGTADSTRIAGLVKGAVDWTPFLATDPDSTPVPTGGGSGPTVFRLWPAYPNPSSGQTAIRVALPQAGRTELVVADALGRLLRQLARGSLEPGEYTWVWDGRDEQGRLAGSGVYFLCLQHGDQTSTSRLVLVR